MSERFPSLKEIIYPTFKWLIIHPFPTSIDSKGFGSCPCLYYEFIRWKLRRKMGVSVFQRLNHFFKHIVDAFNSWQDNRIEFWSCDNILQHVLYCQHALLPMIIAIDHVIWCVVNLAAVDSMQIYIFLLHTSYHLFDLKSMFLPRMN